MGLKIKNPFKKKKPHKAGQNLPGGEEAKKALDKGFSILKILKKK